MRRLLSTTVLTALFSSALVVLPVSAQPGPVRPHPVAPALRTTTATSAGAAFSTIGARWDAGSTGTVQVRARTADGWSGWSDLEAMDAGPDPRTDDAASAPAQVVSAPLWTGDATAYETRTSGDVRGLKVITVDPGTSDADARVGAAVHGDVAQAAASQPTIFTRAQWGADESLRSYNGSGCATPDYTGGIRVGFVHHTDGTNGYAPDDVPGILRGIYAYHVKSNGWCDIGYNFLVDAFGRIWEGRYGGIDRAVLGAHTGGHNANSFGTALIGDFTSLTPPDVMLSGLEDLFAWKLAPYYADPNGTAPLTSQGGGTSRYASGTTNTFNVISGHRDAGYTSCPGDAAYPLLDSIRAGVRQRMAAGLVNPAISSRSATYQGAGVTVTAGTLMQQTWSLDLRKTGDTAVLRTWTGLSTGDLTQLVDLKDATGAWLPSGAYTLTLSSNAGQAIAVPWIVGLDIKGGPTDTAAPPATRFTPVAPARVLDTRTGLGSSIGKAPVGARSRVTVKVVGVGGVPTTGVKAVAVNLTGIVHGGPTYLSAYPADQAWPGTSSLNLAKDQVHATFLMPKVSPDGSITVYNAAGSTDVVVDVVGYLSTDEGQTYTSVTPTRVLDSRTTGEEFANGTIRSVQIAGQAGVPTDATAVVANLTMTGSTTQGLASVFPAGSTRPGTSTLNFEKGEVVTNRFLTGLTDGKLSVYTQVGRADVVIDVVGYVGGTSGSSYYPLDPVRLLDTRKAVGVTTRTKVEGGSTITVPFAGRGNIPGDATSVVFTLTTTDVTRGGYVTAWSGSGPRPGVSDVNTWTAHDVPNLALVQLSGGSLSLFNAGGGIHLVGDAVGYLAPAPAAPTPTRSSSSRRGGPA